MGRPHYVIFQNQEGATEKLRMKQWLRENPAEVPSGMDATDNTAYQLRRALVKNGWRLETLADEVHLIKPNAKGEISYAEEILSADEDLDSVEEEEAEEVTFGLERDLQTALRSNLEQLESGLKITDGGKERIVESGRIDITAEDNKGNNVVIELKAGMANPKVLAQVLAYMGSIATSDKKPVRGIIVAGDFHKKVVLASRAVQNLELKKYSFQFKFGTPRESGS
jgi:hypothetical protein